MTELTHTQAQHCKFVIRGDMLKHTVSFKYLGQWLALDDHDSCVMHAQFLKARKTWAWLSNVLHGEYASPCVCGMFYKAVVQVVLLYGSKTWVPHARPTQEA